MNRVSVIARSWPALVIALMRVNPNFYPHQFTKSPVRIGGMWRAEILA